MTLREITVDPASATPLYRQLAEGLRYRISSGAVSPGSRLPALREASQWWGVNLHTVRRAYHELADAGLVEIRPPVGAFVASPEALRINRDARAMAREFLERARRDFGLDTNAAIGLLHGLEPRSATALQVVECSDTLSHDLALQVAEITGATTSPLRLDRLDNVEPGPVIATYFHYNEVRAAIPNGIGDLHFVAIEPDPASLRSALARAVATGAPRIVLCERDAQLAPVIAADLTRQLPAGGPDLETVVRQDPRGLLDTPERVPVLFSPASWDRLNEAERGLPDAFCLGYRIAQSDALRLEATLAANS